MLQPIKKTLISATAAVTCATRSRLTVAFAIVLCAASLGSVSAHGQDQGQSPTTPDSQSSSNQTKPTTAAPGTVALSKATAAALAPYTGPKYDNRWEVYGGLLFMNGQAGQNTPVRFNMGGAEAMGTYWLNRRFGVAADGRFGAGTTPVISQFYNRVVIMDSTAAGGIQVRGPKDRYVALGVHAFAGGIYEDSTYAINHYPGGSPVSACPTQSVGQQGNLGLYCDHIAPYGFLGTSFDFNESAKIAVRLQPDLTFEHLGTGTREFFSISMGVVYRMGKRK
ncbi:MAG: hypothetical protein HIU91_10335 [Acidobacteria bacterium]|nr:hypothetical protein [Acidobacteriota bacterium]